VRIKTEPGYGGSLARERAANFIQQRYGAAAANQIHQLQAQSQAALTHPGQQRPQGIQLPNAEGQDSKQTQNFVNISQPQRPAISNSQTDGAGDPFTEWKAEVARRREAAEKEKGASDRLIREHVESMGLILEGGGLMAPLGERYSYAKGTKRKIVPRDPISSTSAAASARNPCGSLLAQYDGSDRYDVNMQRDDDEDAINSDLDDPDEMANDGHEAEDAVGQVMLCTYDKVQRVKNKWKCTLKDGILSSGGKE
jgi:transcription initiation factor TFIIA large subunit